MLIIQHRANSPFALPKETNVAEIDVHISHNDEVVVKHNPNDKGWCRAKEFLELSRFEKFFIDIKQNLCVGDLMKIMREFDNRSIGLFDVPMPSAYFLAREGVNFYARLSQYEPAQGLTNKYWMDPLGLDKDDANLGIYVKLLYSTRKDDKIILACPSLHGRFDEAREMVWTWAMEYAWKIEGIVTKKPLELRDFIDG